MTATFKPFEQKDIDTVLSMMEDFYSIDNYPIDLSIVRQLLHDFIANESMGKGWIICSKGTTVGYIMMTFILSFEYKGHIAFIDELYIKPEARGSGLGKIVIDFVQEQAKRYNVKMMYLEVEEHNVAAKKLYMSKNFTYLKRQVMSKPVE